MTTFVWKNEYMTGVQGIDEQHKKLSDFLHELEQLANQISVDSRKARRKIVLLGAYIKAHFSYVEEWLFRNGYYLGEQSKVIDREFLECYEASRHQVNEEITKELLETLFEATKKWLVNHINVVNKAISEKPSSNTPDLRDLPLIAQIQSNLLGGEQKTVKAFAY